MNPIAEREATQDIWNSKARTVVNSLIRRLLGQGATGDRPNNPVNGQMYYDNTLKTPIWWNSEDAEWKDATGTAA